MESILVMLLLVGLLVLYYVILPRLGVPTWSPLSRTSCGTETVKEHPSDDAKDDMTPALTGRESRTDVDTW